MRRGLNRFLLKLVLMGLPVLVGYEVLYRLRIYPVLTNSQLFDNKMLDVQRHPPRAVKLLAMGSSVTLYDLDSRMLARAIESQALTLTELLDQYHWVTITRRHKVPTSADLTRWIGWASCG